EFISEAESLEGLRHIIGICETAIDAILARRTELDAARSAGDFNLTGVARQGETRTWSGGEGCQPHNLPKIPAPPPPIVDENTGEVVDGVRNDGVAAAAAFGGNAKALDAIGNPTVSGTQPPAPPTGTANAPPATATSATGATLPPAPPATVERDSANVPYDDRIHSEGRTKNNDGTWRFRRKLDEAVKAAVLAEIMAGSGNASPAANGVPGASGIPGLPPPPPPPPAPVTLPPAGTVPVPPPPALGVPDAAVANVVPTVNPTSAPPAPPAPNASATAGTTAPGGASRINFKALIIKLNKAISAGTVSQDALTLACRELGLGEGPAALGVPTNAHLCDALHDLLFPNG
ncbi:MAG: hypothetical protein ACREB0_13065, partial [Sphingopyxis sp.]